MIYKSVWRPKCDRFTVSDDDDTMNVFFTGSSSGYACDDGPTDGRCQMANVKLEGEFIVIDDGGTNVAIPLGTSATDWEAIARKYTDVAGSGKGCCAAEMHTALEIRTFKTTVLAKLQCMYPQHHVEADTINVVRPGDHFAVHSGTAGCKHSNLTAVLFLNWDFGGGSLEFPNIGYRHRPVKGRCVTRSFLRWPLISSGVLFV